HPAFPEEEKMFQALILFFFTPRGPRGFLIVMRTAIFLLLSLALHAMALSYPVFFSAPRNAELLPVIVLGIEDRSGGDVGEDGGSESRNSRQLPPKRVGRIEGQGRTNARE